MLTALTTLTPLTTLTRQKRAHFSRPTNRFLIRGSKYGAGYVYILGAGFSGEKDTAARPYEEGNWGGINVELEDPALASEFRILSTFLPVEVAHEFMLDYFLCVTSRRSPF